MTYREIHNEELEQVTDVVGRAFRFDGAAFAQRMREGQHRYDARNARVWAEAGQVVAALFTYQRDLTVSGAMLPAGLVGLVSVPPEQRRRGYAHRLMSALLQEFYAAGLPISLLYPYDIDFYRRLGYGIVNEAWYLELPLDQLSDFDEMRRVVRLDSDDLPKMEALFEQERSQRNGWLSRRKAEWIGRLLPDPADGGAWPRQREMVGLPDGDGGLSGYLIYTLAPVENPPARGGATPRELHVYEWVSATDEAWRALAGFVAAQRAQADFLRYTAPVDFPLPYAVRNRTTYRDLRQSEFCFRDMFSWTAGLMGRLIDWPTALRKRGWPTQLTGQTVLQMDDPLFPANNDPLALSWHAGRAAVQPSDDPATARADVSTWSELYAGTLSPRVARLLGRLDADEPTIALLDQAFACDPWFLPSADWF